ncbi:DENN domain-containing protein 1C isoform 2 [Daubentonia madagascariensis]|uniref:DENN domain-containing protein 1C isoform 2 n=2 Tax=Daubentonia madagascariensis TaxID=31869 RepID=A0ABD2DBY5_DAUMA
MQMVPKFCFPFDVEREPPSSAVQHFTFALTDLAGNRRFGFCRLRAGAQSCLCILSHLPWFEVFYKLLNTVGDLLAQDQVSEAEGVLLDLLQQPPHGSQASVDLELDSGVTMSSAHSVLPPAPGNSKPLSCFVAPDSGRLPSIPENRNLTELVLAVTNENIVGLFAALLAERRVLLTSSKLSTLTSCVHASCALLYPMRWEHVLIPTLPPHLLDYCCAPMPYFIGVHASLAEKVREKALEDVVMMNVDSNTLETPFDDVQALPPDVVSLLRLRLRKVALAPGEGVSRLFLKAQALLFGGYRDALVCSPGQPVTFSEEAFLAQKPGAPLQAFHQRAVHLQLFKQDGDSGLQRGGSLRALSHSDRLQQRRPIIQHFGQNRPLRPSRRLRQEEGPSEPPGEGTPPLSPEGAQGLWAEEALDSSFLGSGEELDLLSEILDSLSVEAKSAGSLRPSQSLNCCHRGDLDSCLSLPNIPGRAGWQPDEEKTPEPQPLSLPVHLLSLQHAQSSDATGTSKNPNSQLPSEADQEVIPSSQSLTAAADTSSRGDPASSPSTEPLILHLSPPHKADEDSRAQESSCSTLPTAPTQPNPPESPQFLAPTKPNFDTAWTSQPLHSSSEPRSPENPRAQPPKVLLARHALLQPLEEQGAPNPPAATPSNWQEPQARSQPRVADLKKCFEG